MIDPLVSAFVEPAGRAGARRAAGGEQQQKSRPCAAARQKPASNELSHEFARTEIEPFSNCCLLGSFLISLQVAERQRISFDPEALELLCGVGSAAELRPGALRRSDDTPHLSRGELHHRYVQHGGRQQIRVSLSENDNAAYGQMGELSQTATILPDADSAFCRDRNRCSMSRAGSGRLNRYPCISVQPSAVIRSSCSLVSTPSAVAVMPMPLANAATARTMLSDPAFSVTSFTKERSILILSNG